MYFYSRYISSQDQIISLWTCPEKWLYFITVIYLNILTLTRYEFLWKSIVNHGSIETLSEIYNNLTKSIYNAINTGIGGNFLDFGEYLYRSNTLFH